MTSGSRPDAVAVRRAEIAERLAAADGLLVGLDFDGTLAPIDADHDDPTITPTCRRSVERLSTRSDATVAVISGRELSDLRPRVGVEGVVYAGNHGLEIDGCDGTFVHPDAANARPRVARLLDELADRLDGIPGWTIEDKSLTATVHVRETPDDRVDEVRTTIEAVVRSADEDLRVVAGKQAFEIRPAVGWDKGSAVERLASDLPDGWRTVYVGDDVTDDDAFRAARPGGFGVLVGAREGSDAAYRLPTQGEVASFLDWLVDGVLERHRDGCKSFRDRPTDTKRPHR